MSNLEIICPCCQATIVVDGVSGEILLHKEKPGRTGKSFEEMVTDLAASKSEMEKKFEKGIESQRDRARILEERGCGSSFLGYHGTYPATLCLSPNDVIVHGIPSSRRLQAGDILVVVGEKQGLSRLESVL